MSFESRLKWGWIYGLGIVFEVIRETLRPTNRNENRKKGLWVTGTQFHGMLSQTLPWNETGACLVLELQGRTSVRGASRDSQTQTHRETIDPRRKSDSKRWGWGFSIRSDLINEIDREL